MKTEYHSIWLMPCPEHEKMFSEVVQDLAKRFDSPVFQPHLTLVEDMARTCEELEALLTQVAAGAGPFDAGVETVEESPLYFRSFYARFPVSIPLRAIKERAVTLFGVGSVASFMPHISLAYGVQESPGKSETIAALRQRLTGISIHFDRVCIVASSQHTPIEEWVIRSCIVLRA